MALVACERSGRVRSALRDAGVDAWSCDLVPADDGSPHHIVGDALTLLDDGWGLLVAHPPCTYLTMLATPCLEETCPHTPPYRSPHGALRRQLCIDAAVFFRRLLDAEQIPMRAVENPQPHAMAHRLMGQHQGTSQPWHHGDPWQKRTWWWLRGLQPLTPTGVVEPRAYLVGGAQRRDADRPGWTRITNGSSSPDTVRIRSETSPGTARAIAAQWTSASALF